MKGDFLMRFGKKSGILVLSLALTGTLLAGCSTKGSDSATSDNLTTITKNAKKEGMIRSVGMPDTWANWVGTWNDLKDKYGLKHQDTDMSSAQELQNFKSVGKTANAADLGDIGINVAPTAVKQNLLMSYKTKYWDEIPAWAKDSKGYWSAGYTGTIAFITDTKNVKASDAPTTWKQLADGKYNVDLGDVTSAAQSQYAVLAAAVANGGNEKDIQPGIKFFQKLQKEHRLSTNNLTVQNLQKGETQVAIVWDFNALNYRKLIGDNSRYKITIPTDGSVMSGYAEVINKNAAHPNAAKLARNYILSDAGQINLAKGFARPIRTDVKLPADIAAQLLPDSDYKGVYHVKDADAWNTTTLKLAQLWQSEVLGK